MIDPTRTLARLRELLTAYTAVGETKLAAAVQELIDLFTEGP